MLENLLNDTLLDSLSPVDRARELIDACRKFNDIDRYKIIIITDAQRGPKFKHGAIDLEQIENTEVRLEWWDILAIFALIVPSMNHLLK